MAGARFTENTEKIGAGARSLEEKQEAVKQINQELAKAKTRPPLWIPPSSNQLRNLLNSRMHFRSQIKSEQQDDHVFRAARIG